MTKDEALIILKNTSPLKITVSGDIGAGKSTFAKKLAEILEIPRIYMGQFMREEAAKRKMTFDELRKLLEKDPSLDHQLDELQSERSLYIQRGIFEGRTSWHFVQDPTIKVYLSVDSNIATERIWRDRDDKRDKYGTIEALRTANEERKRSDISRYQKYYGIDVYNTTNYDVVIDTTNLDVDEVFEKTIVKIAQKLK
jgi:cytidylate kinase